MVAVKVGPLAPLQRRNTITAVDYRDTSIPIRPQSSSFFVNDSRSGCHTELADWSLISIAPSSYTSLKDLLQTTPYGTQSAVAGERCSCCCVTNGDGREIPIRNRLVKQAAWAYLQPMAVSPSNSDRNLFQQLWSRFSARYLEVPPTSCFGYLKEWFSSWLVPALHRLLGILRFQTAR
ncbi:hypothetical protein EJ110_NYTH13917 [Nymphaea thermarum]|nr:hypothetical protein EJ110_NYTH13917 [Nymphaea thermarum]